MLRLAAYFFVLNFSRVFAQSEDSLSPSAPTNFGTKLDVENDSDLEPMLKESSGSFLRNSGNGKTQTLSIRGANAPDIAITLEGVPLNSGARGEFDFSTLSPFGLSDGKIIRGGYSPYSSSPSGQVMLSLPRDEKSEAHLSVGSYQSFGLGIRVPNASFYLDQSENNFPYWSVASGGERERAHNASQRLNARVWKRMENHFVWTQILYSDQDLPGPVTALSTGSSQTLSPSIAYQGHWKIFDWSLWGNFQRQAFSEPDYQLHTLNRSWSSGFREQARWAWTEKIQLEGSLEWTQDKLFSETSSASTYLDAPLRQVLSLALASYMSPSEDWLLHPQLRGEYVSDLAKEHFSFHPGFGARYRATENLDALMNMSFISRAPNFNEMYFKTTGFWRDNPNLNRQRAYQADIGYEARGQIFNSISLKVQQAVFVDRTEKLLQTMPVVGALRTEYQVQNIGTSLTYGLENEADFKFHRYFDLSANYTLQSSEVSDSDRVYQPTHLLVTTPVFFPDEQVRVSVPFYFRSEVSAPQNSWIDSQYDLGLKFESQIQEINCRLEFFNLLELEREEQKGFPLSNERSAKLSANMSF